MSELELAQAELARLERMPIPEDVRDRTRLRMKIQGAHNRIIRACNVIELEQTK